MAADVAALPDPPQSPKPQLPPDTLTSVTAFARFEFEPGKGNEGTKILMVEWQDEDNRRDISGSWLVEWSGKITTLPAEERPSDNARRVYFMLPPGMSVPPHLSLLHRPDGQVVSNAQRLAVYPLPAIFTPELGVTAKASGKKGVLHTIWAKKRLHILNEEIQREQEFNLEGIALEMALAEKDWIENTFGLAQRANKLDLSGISRTSNGPVSPTLQSPSSPCGRRLSDKLRGLSIGTSERDLRVNTPIRESHPLSPEGTDVAYSSFKSFHSGTSSARLSGQRKVVSQAPPESIKSRQTESPTASLGYVSPSITSELTDGLFAKELSPRSPDLPKSPFSFSTAEVAPSAKVKGE